VLNLLTSLPDTAVVFYFYLELQNSELSKVTGVSSQISYMIFCQKFSSIQFILWEYERNIKPTEICQFLLTYLPSLFYIASCRPPIEAKPVGLVQ
jgi:hypothetical protein